MRSGTCALNGRIDRKSTRLNSSHTEIYTLSLHDALPILLPGRARKLIGPFGFRQTAPKVKENAVGNMRFERANRSEEHTSELQSHRDLHSFPTRRSSDLTPRSCPEVDRAIWFPPNGA